MIVIFGIPDPLFSSYAYNFINILYLEWYGNSERTMRKIEKLERKGEIQKQKL